MSKTNWFKNLIFEETESKEEQPLRKEAAASQPVSKPAANLSPEVQSPQTAKTIDAATISGTVDKTLLNKLCSVLDEQSIQGIDYLKFKKSVDSLKSIQPEEDMRFATAFLTLKATSPSLSKEYLIQTIEQYVGVMEQERKVGLNELKSLRSKEIDSKEKEIANARAKVENMKAEIQRLNQFILENESEVVVKKNEITIKEANFNTTIDAMVKQLQDDKIKIETIIKQ